MAGVDYQYEYRGLTFGMGTDYPIISVEGLEDDAVRMGDAVIPRRGGDIQGLHVAASRSIVMEIGVRGTPGSTTMRAKIQALIDAFQHSDDAHALKFQEPGMDQRYVSARPVGRVAKRNGRYKFTAVHKVRLKLADPRTYAVVGDSEILPHYSATGGGLDYAITDYGKDYTVDASSEVVVTNDGNADAYPVLQFFGPTVGTVTQVTLTNTTTDESVVFDTTILTGQILTADMHSIVTVAPSDQHVVRLGSTNKYSEWAQPRTPFKLVAGDNVLRFEITGGTSTDATCAVNFKDTWL